MKKYFFISSVLMFVAGKCCLAQSISVQQFKNPPSKYRPVPFWHLNGKLTPEGVKKQVTDAGRSGFGGVAVLPVTAGPQYPSGLPAPGMSPAYLSDEYFNRYADILNTARANKLQVILYDDIDFPSGTAGGKLKKLYPWAVRKSLVKTDTVINGGHEFKMPLPEGTLMAVVGYKDSIANREDLTAFATNGQFKWAAPEGRWKIMFFTTQNIADGIVDYMNDKAVEKFITLTYNEYAKRFPGYFGTVIKQTFYDDVGYVGQERGWTNSFNEAFRHRFGKNPVLYYPALWQDIGPETEAARAALYDTRAELLGEGFPKVIAAWGKQHGLKSSGHPPGNYEIQPVDMNFDIFKFYRHQDIPTMDAIFYHGHGREGFKLVSSAAAVYDRPEVASETYGAFFEDSFDVNMLYRTAMEIFARGINFLVPHGMWYDPDPKSVRIPPLISPYSAKIGPALKRYNNFAARSCMLLQGGRTVSEIGVIYPIASLEGFYHFQAPDNKALGKYAPPGTDYLKISDMLTNGIHQDFTFIHPELFTGEKYQLKNKQVILANKENIQKYKVIILPAGCVISYATLSKLKLYFDKGGKLIATGILPSKSAEFGKDAEVQRLVTQIFGNTADGQTTDSVFKHTNKEGGAAIFIMSLNEKRLQRGLDDMVGAPDVLIENNPQPSSANGAFSYIHKINKGRDVYYFANSTDDNIGTYIKLRGKLNPQLWDPNTGKVSKCEAVKIITVKGQIYTQMKLSLQPVKSVFIVSDHSDMIDNTF